MDHGQQWLSELIEAFDVPGAALGIRHGKDRFECAAGVLNQQTAVAATPDSVFQIGSITKVWTTTLIMGLADEARLDLDASVQTYLPGFRVADEAASATITVRQLLCHTSGFDGDLFTDTGRGDDALERFVVELSQQQQVFAPGAAWSYNNAAFDVAGRVVEAVTGTTWDQALADRLVGPLGASRTGTLPEQALLHRAAAGHITDPDGTVRLATTWALPRSSGPAGLITASVGDLLDFAWMHLHGGHPEVVSDAARAEMAREQVRLPAPLGASRTWGLGWSRFHWSTTGGEPVIVLGHDGATIGQFAFLRAWPGPEVSPSGRNECLIVALLTNGGQASALAQTVLTEVFAERTRIQVPEVPAPPTEPMLILDRAMIVGTYAQSSARLDVLASQGTGLELRHVDTSGLADGNSETWTRPLVPVSATEFLVRPPLSGQWQPVTFCTLDGGSQVVYLGGRAHPRPS